MTDIIVWISGNILWGIPMIVAMLFTGILITVRLRAIQVRKFGDSLSSTIVPTVKSIGKKSTCGDGKTKSISQNLKIAMNTLDQAAMMVQQAGVDISVDISETEDEVIYVIKMKK